MWMHFQHYHMLEYLGPFHCNIESGQNFLSFGEFFPTTRLASHHRPFATLLDIEKWETVSSSQTGQNQNWNLHLLGLYG